MHTHFPRAIALLVLAASGCGGGEGPNETFTVQVTPANATLFSAAPGNTAEVSAAARDRNGQALPGGTTTFSSGNVAVATVTNAGVVTAVAPGTAQITAAITLDGATVSGTAAITVEEADAAATVRAPAFFFNPGTVDVRAGGTVTWTIADVHHSIEFQSSGAPADIGELLNASESRAFPASGTFSYRCGIHPEMAGVVRVH
jgi:plastocyanin